MHNKQLIKSTNNNSDNNYYAILDLSRTATSDEIRSSYMRLTRTYHTDKNNNANESTERFIKIKQAYETLIDPVKRSNYDLTVHASDQNTEQQYLTLSEQDNSINIGQDSSWRSRPDIKKKLREIFSETDNSSIQILSSSTLFFCFGEHQSKFASIGQEGNFASLGEETAKTKLS